MNLKKIWHFIYKDDSMASFIVNIILAFIIIKFIFYPVVGLVMGTGFPIVAVLSESMEHNLHDNAICGHELDYMQDSFDNYWSYCGSWYENINITAQEFRDYPLSDGFNKGDVIIVMSAKNLEKGDIIIFNGGRAQPIIHRIVKVNENSYQTKGDHNSNSIPGLYGETNITPDRILGKAVLRVPYLGWIKILFVNFLNLFGVNVVA
jgi:signal peptidase I